MVELAFVCLATAFHEVPAWNAGGEITTFVFFTPSSGDGDLSQFSKEKEKLWAQILCTAGRKHFLWQNLPQICHCHDCRSINFLRWLDYNEVTSEQFAGTWIFTFPTAELTFRNGLAMSVAKLCCHIECLICLMVWWCQNLPPQHACTPPPLSRHKSEAQFACRK